MDSHYHKVMAAREQVQETGSKLYFAYSGVLDRDAFETWKVEHSYQFFNLPEGQVAQALDLNLIFDFPSRWWGGRVAGLVAEKGAAVFGRLFEIPAKEWPIVQHKEGVITGMSIEKKIKVLVNGQEVEAIAFTTAPSRASTEGLVSARYVDSLTRGAQQAGLPQEYIAKLKDLAK